MLLCVIPCSLLFPRSVFIVYFTLRSLSSFIVSPGCTCTCSLDKQTLVLITGRLVLSFPLPSLSHRMGDVLAQETCQRLLVNLCDFSFKIPIIVRGCFFSIKTRRCCVLFLVFFVPFCLTLRCWSRLCDAGWHACWPLRKRGRDY